jgi:hypothetical protein
LLVQAGTVPAIGTSPFFGINGSSRFHHARHLAAGIGTRLALFSTVLHLVIAAELIAAFRAFFANVRAYSIP